MKIPSNKRYLLFGGSFLLANKLQLVGDKTMKGVSIKQWFLMRNLADMPAQPPTTITALAKEVDSTRQNVTKLLQILARQGLVQIDGNPNDKRSYTVCITKKGEEWQTQIAKDAKPFLENLFCGIADDECAVAAKVMVKMIDNLMDMQKHI